MTRDLKLAALFQALADPTRLRILALLRVMELSVGELAQLLGQSQPRVSRHVKILSDSGLIGRRKELIIRGGQNIYPADIEEVLYHVTGVSEVAVIGVPDDSLGEVPVAYVAVKPGESISPGALIARCKEELAYYKVPAAVHFLPELPKGPTGKILRRALRSQ